MVLWCLLWLRSHFRLRGLRYYARLWRHIARCAFSPFSPIDESIVLEFHPSFFSTILPLHWTQVEYCFIFVRLLSLVSTIFHFTLWFPGDLACQTRSGQTMRFGVGSFICLPFKSVCKQKQILTKPESWRHLPGIPFGHRWPNGR